MDKLYIEKVYIKIVPSDIDQFFFVTIISIHCNKIVEIPAEVYNLVNLKELSFAFCNILSIPLGISKLTELLTFDVGDLVLTKSNIPDDLKLMLINGLLIGYGRSFTWEQSTKSALNILQGN